MVNDVINSSGGQRFTSESAPHVASTQQKVQKMPFLSTSRMASVMEFWF